MNEANLNGFPSSKIAERIQEDPYRLLVCADKFQTGYDEPLLHTMYVDKTLSGIRAVQTLSRLNRAHPKKHDTFVLDFMNTTDVITESFTPFYRGTALSDETDPNKLHDLMADLDAAQVYSNEQIEEFTRRYLEGAERDQLDPMLDTCIPVYKKELDEDGQVAFKGTAKSFRAHLRVPRIDTRLHQPNVGNALDLPEFPDPEAAVTARGRSVQGHSRRHRHGQLPGRETGDAEDSSPGRGRRD